MEANVEFTTNQTTPRTASQLTNAIIIIEYQESGCPASSTKVSTAATVRLGSRKGLIKSKIRHSQLLLVFSSNLHSSRLCHRFGKASFSLLVFCLLQSNSSMCPVYLQVLY